MRPSPFGNKLKKGLKRPHLPSKKEEGGEDNEGREEQKSNRKEKTPQEIYAALEEVGHDEFNDHNSPQHEEEKQAKKAVGLKPKFKLGRKHGDTSNNVTNLPSEKKIQENANEEEVRNRPTGASKPSFFNKRKFQKKNDSREKVIIEDQREKNMEEESFEGSISQNPSFVPQFKIQKGRFQENKTENQHKTQQFPLNQNSSEPYNLEAHLPRQINVDVGEVKVSEAKVEKQRVRSEELSKLLNLQIDLYEEMLSISCVTAYEVYINKIKNGSLKNSCDQSFDEKVIGQCQTLPLEFDDFTNQCPQDYSTDISNIVEEDSEEAFQRFVKKVAPILEELIKPSSEVIMPPIFLLALRPTFQRFLNCPLPVFVYESESLGLGIMAIGEKLYISETQIISVLSLGNFLVGGGKNGTLMLWSGRNNVGSSLYRKVYNIIESRNFELTECDSSGLDKFSVYWTDAQIVSLLEESREQFTSLDSDGKMILWGIESTYGKGNELKPKKCVEFMSQLRRPNLIAYQVKKRNDTHFISTSAGILVWSGDVITQILNVEGSEVVDFQLPHRSSLLYAVFEDGSLRIFDQNYSNHLLQLELPGVNARSIIVPEIQYENRKVSLSNNFFIGGKGSIYAFNLLKNKVEGVCVSSSAESDRSVIYQGTNVLPNALQQITLWKDLKCTSQSVRMNVDLQPSPTNVKSILEDNRRLYHMLEAEPSIVVS